MKTPEQIAADTARPDALDCPVCGIRHPYIAHWPCAGAFDDARVVAAIKADRTQRADPLARVRAVLDAEIGWETPAALKDRIEWAVGDDEEPASADERDYGKYLDQQFWGDH